MMKTKTAILATLGIFVGAIVLGLVVLFAFFDPNSAADVRRAGMLGQGLAMFCMIPLFVIWIMWAVRIRKEREQKQAEAKAGKQAEKRSPRSASGSPRRSPPRDS